MGFMLLDQWFYVHVFVDCCLSFYPFYFGHCIIVCPSIYGYLITPLAYSNSYYYFFAFYHFLSFGIYNFFTKIMLLMVKSSTNLWFPLNISLLYTYKCSRSFEILYELPLGEGVPLRKCITKRWRLYVLYLLSTFYLLFITLHDNDDNEMKRFLQVNNYIIATYV